MGVFFFEFFFELWEDSASCVPLKYIIVFFSFGEILTFFGLYFIIWPFSLTVTKLCAIVFARERLRGRSLNYLCCASDVLLHSNETCLCSNPGFLIILLFHLLNQTG